MKPLPVLAVVAAIGIIIAASACGGAAAPAARSGAQPAVQSSSSSGGGSSQAPAPGTKAAPATSASKPSSGGSIGPVALEKVNMPSGTTFDPYKPVKIGDVVELPVTNTVLQVTGAKTVDYDAQKDLLLVDLIVGNKGKEKMSVSSVLTMGALTSDWHAYNLSLDELPNVAMKIAELKLAQFDGEIPAGEARKGTAVIPVPKDAKGLGFSFSPMNTADILKNDPPVYVGLGIKGDFPFPIIPDSVEAFKAGTTYKVGQAVKAPKRGVAIQVNGAMERTQSLPNLQINVADKYVLVDVTTRLFGTASPIIGDKEFSLVDSGGRNFGGYLHTVDATPLLTADSLQYYSSENRRGVLVFKSPRDAKELKLVFAPSPDEKIEFDLGTLSQMTSAPASGGVSSVAQATATTVAPPKLADSSVLPAELKSIPIPPGFKVVDGTVSRSASQGKFKEAVAQWFGKMEIKDLKAFYNDKLATDWDLNDEDDNAGYIQNDYINKKDDSLTLYINAEQTDKGTTLDIQVEHD